MKVLALRARTFIQISSSIETAATQNTVDVKQNSGEVLKINNGEVAQVTSRLFWGLSPLVFVDAYRFL